MKKKCNNARSKRKIRKIAENKDKKEIKPRPKPRPKQDIKQMIEAMEEEWPLLKSKYILSDVVSTLNLSSFDPKNNTLKIKILDFIISKLQKSIQCIIDCDYNKDYSLYLRSNRNLLTFGYIRIYSKDIVIPMDIIKYIFKFFDNGIVWIIKDKIFDKFLNCEYREVLYGTKFEVINEMECELTICPNGYFYGQNGFVACFFEVKSIPIWIKSITISMVLYWKEMDFETRRTIIYHHNGRVKAHGWTSHTVKCEDVLIDKLKSIHIECITDYVHIEYDESYNKENIISLIPDIKDIIYEWYIDDILLDKFRNIRPYRYVYGDTFYNDCWVISCGPNGFSSESEGFVRLYLELLRLPFGLKAIEAKYQFIAHCDDKQYEIESEEIFSLNMDNTNSRGQNLFQSKHLHSISNLSFTVKIIVVRTIPFHS